MKLLGIGVALAFACSASSVMAYTIKTYQHLGASRVQACSLAKQAAQSPTEEVAHGKMLKVSACECTVKNKSGSPTQWHCLVQATHDR